jgi:predicted O-methyltransferase YrrM
MVSKFKATAGRIPGIQRASRMISWALFATNKGKLLENPDSYYSPIPSIDGIRKKENRIWPKLSESSPGIDLNIEEQLSYLDEFKAYYSDIPFKETKLPNLRYYYNNYWYTYSDAIILYSMIRKLKPQRIIEIGSGYSSCIMLDVNEIFFQNKIQITFIEPEPSRLISLTKKDDLKKHRLVQQEIQNIDKNLLDSLTRGDILFIDSSHISKAGSDVNDVIFEVLPSLNKDVYIHFHDVMYPFEYPKQWVYEGRFFNEAYLLRAFLQYNDSFSIVYFNTYLEHFYKKRIEESIPLCLKEAVNWTPVHGSIWLKKII